MAEYQEKVKGKQISNYNYDDTDVDNEHKLLSVSNENFIPLGSIVTLHGSNKKIMIMGRLLTNSKDKSNMLYDYYGCSYPEGSISMESNVLTISFIQNIIDIRS